jgi:MoxR-like ATPase
MEEEQVTVDGTTREVPDPFVVIATQNSVERDRTYELPAAELDRFMKKLGLGYPEEEEESEMLARVVGEHPIERLAPVATVDEVIAARRSVGTVTVEDAVREYVTALARFTREHATLGVSPRGSIALLQAAQARAALNGRDYVVPDDVQREAVVTFAHRIRPAPDGDRSARSLVEQALDRVDV